MEDRQSPVINKNKPVVGMDFPEAMKAVINGKRITRVEWGDSREYGCLQNGLLVIHTKGKDHSWTVSEGDLMAHDWLAISDLKAKTEKDN